MANAWLDHVKDYRAQNPNKSYTEALVEAKKTYKSSTISSSSSKSNKKVKNSSMKENKKEKKQKKSNKNRKSVSNPWIEHVKQFRKENQDLTYTEALVEAKKTYNK